MNIWNRPVEGSESPAGGSGGPALLDHHYFAFLSYSHADAKDADWLHGELENFRVPSSLAGKLTGNGVIPKRLVPIFRDRQELAAAHDLTGEIRQALHGSRCLIVLCSPAAAKSHWTNAEIEEFKRIHPEGCVIAAIVAGEPFASEIPGREKEECFPPAIRQKYDRRGRATGKRAEPLAADLRESGDGRRLGLLKVVAGILGLGLDDLVQREHLRRQRRLAGIAAGSLAGMLVATALALTAIESRDEARDQRRAAESLVEFMLGDLKDKLEPIGRLDVLDSVGARALAYYETQDMTDMSDDALGQRSKAMTLLGQVARDRGDLQSAQRFFEEAAKGSAEVVERDPADPERLYEHAQNIFWMADVSRQRGHTERTEAGLREYKRLADRMVALEPDNMQWRMERQSADANLGVALYERRRFDEAIAQFHQALQHISALAVANPSNTDFQKSLTESQTWLASALTAAGRLSEARQLRERHVAGLHARLKRTGDMEYRQKLVPAERYLGQLYLFSGRVEDALERFRTAVAESEALLSRDSDNRRWSFFAARARIDLGQALIATGRSREAAIEIGRACDDSQRLIATDPNIQRWRAVQRDCFITAARLAADAGDAPRALRTAERAVMTAESVSTTDRVEDRFGIASAYRILGDVRRLAGDGDGAQKAWRKGLSAIPAGVPQQPMEMAEHAILLDRLGEHSKASALSRRLTDMGYRQT